jgi:Big-like domain-containing protein
MKRVGILSVVMLALFAAGTLSYTACGGGGTPTCAWPLPQDCDGTCAECCSDDDCEGDATCSSGACQCPSGFDMSCEGEGLFCVACCEDTDCDDAACPGQVICDEGECETLSLAAGEDCSKDASACCPGLACDVFTNTCVTECAADAECHALDMAFSDDLSCKNGVCDFDHCRKDADCAGGKVCFDGDCVTIPDCSDIASCRVVPGSAVTQENSTVQLAASAYFQSGALAPGVTFTWASDATDSAAVGATGLVTGGAVTGDAVITATVGGGCTTTCTAAVSNYGAVEAEHTRVIVVSELEGTPVEGAVVTIGAEAPVTTGANGVADVAVNLETTPADIDVFHAEYNYLSIRNANQRNMIVHLGKLYHLDFTANPPVEVAGGIKGVFDFTRIPCEEGNTCDVLFGLGGLSIPGNLVNLNFDLLIGGMIKTEIQLGGATEVLGLPSGLTLCLNATCFKEYFKPTGIPGNRAAWGLGGKMNLADLIDVLGPVISGGDDIDFGSILVSLLPEFAKFYTAIVPNLDIDPIAKVVDVDDIDDDGHVDDYVPDYDNLAGFPLQDMTLKVAMDQTMTFTIGTMPANPAGGWWYDGVIVLGGVIAKDVGLIPLGISAGLDAETKEDSPDGQIGDISLNVSDVAGRIPEGQVQRVVIALALNMGGLIGGEGGLSMGGRVMFVDDFTGTHNLSGFLTPPTTATYAGRALTVAGVPAEATYQQVIFTGSNESNWNVIGVFGDETYTLPDAPAQGDRSAGANFISIKLKDGLTYQDLLNFDEDNMGKLVELVESFCFHEVTEE